MSKKVKLFGKICFLSKHESMTEIRKVVSQGGFNIKLCQHNEYIILLLFYNILYATNIIMSISFVIIKTFIYYERQLIL